MRAATRTATVHNPLYITATPTSLIAKRIHQCSVAAESTPESRGEGQSLIGKISRRPLRAVWRHEERDFTVWLRDNIDVLSDQLGFELVNPEREQVAGNFSVDIVAETADGRPVVIENQLERSDHDHLGKLLTYLASFEARVAIWIVSEPRPEHVQAVTWLNQANLVDFYLFKVEAVVIGDSAAAPLLTKIVGPSVETTAVGATKKEFAERHELRQRFWSSFIPAAGRAGILRGNRAARTDNWIDRREGPIAWILSIREHDAQVTLYVDGYGLVGNEAFVRSLLEHQPQIEERFGAALEWDIVEGRKHAKVVARIAGLGYREPEDRWPELERRLINTYAGLRAACDPYLAGADRAGRAAGQVVPTPEA